MTTIGFLDVVRFNAVSSGTGDFVVSSAVMGYQTPGSAGAVNGTIYRYRAESADLSQWEVGYGAYASGTVTLARTTVLFSSSGSKVSFSAPPQVGVVLLAEDLNVLPTTQVFTSGSGTYTTPSGARWILIEMIGGGGGGAGSGTTPGSGGAGGNTTFGTGPIISCPGGAGAIGVAGGAGGIPSGGYLNMTGGTGSRGSGLTATSGGLGANSPYGGAGAGGAAGAGAGVAAAVNTGSGGGGGGVNATVNGGGGGGAGGFSRAIINNPDASYSYAVGAAGTAGTAGTSGAAGGAGGSGLIQITEFYAN